MDNKDDILRPHPLSSQEGEYLFNLGRFITLFADAEAVLRLHCMWASGLSEGVAGIVFGDLTVLASINLLPRLLREKGLPADDDLKRVLKQLAVISDTRNAILHRGVRMSDVGFMTSQGLPNSRLPPRLVDPEVLEDMHADLGPIMAGLMLSKPGGYPEWEEWAEGVRTAVRSPWRYMPRPS